MSKSTIVFIILLIVFAGLLGYNYVAKPFAGPTISSPSASSSPTPIATTPSNFDQLTTEQRVALMIAAPIEIHPQGQVDADQLAWIHTHQPGVVTLFGDKITTQSAYRAIAQLSTDTYRPLLAVDHEGGTVQRFNGDGFTTLPSWQKLCLQPAAQRQQQLLQSANELQALGIDIVFGPVVDLTASGSALGSRTCGSSPELVAQRAQEYIEAFSGQGMLPVAKHFPGIGSLKQDLHTEAAMSTANQEELKVYQYIFSTHPSMGVMMAHVSLPGLNGEVCSLSQQCVQGFKNLFNQAIVFTDALEMASANATKRTLAERALAAVKAGNDVLVFGKDINAEQLEAVDSALITGYATDADLKTAIDAAAKKVFTMHKKP